MEVCIFLFVVVFNGVKEMPPPPTTMPGHTHAKYNALHTHAKFIDFLKVYKSCKAVSSTNRKPNMVKPMLLAGENPAIGKNCFHFYQ